MKEFINASKLDLSYETV